MHQSSRPDVIAFEQYRAPEEMRDDWLDEKIDVFSFGNNVYGLLTGLWVFYENDDDSVVQVSRFDRRAVALRRDSDTGFCRSMFIAGQGKGW